MYWRTPPMVAATAEEEVAWSVAAVLRQIGLPGFFLTGAEEPLGPPGGWRRVSPAAGGGAGEAQPQASMPHPTGLTWAVMSLGRLMRQTSLPSALLAQSRSPLLLRA